MRLLSCVAKTGLWAMLALATSYGAILNTVEGNAYGGSGIRANFLTLLPSLTYTSVDFFTACTAANSCIPSYNSGPQSINNISGTVFGGATFTGANSGIAGNQLYVRQISGSRNSIYTPLNGNGGFPQWTSGLATADGFVTSVTGTPSITITLAPGTRSAGFDFGQRNSLPSSFNITATSASGSVTITPTNRYDTGGLGSPNYLTTGPGFYGVTSSLEDILTITIVANASTNPNWVLDVANFRAGVQINAPTPEPATFLAMGSALILISFLLRRRGKFARGGAA